MCLSPNHPDSMVEIVDFLLQLPPERLRDELVRLRGELEDWRQLYWARHDAPYLGMMTDAEKFPLRGDPCWDRYAEALRKELATIEAMRR